MRSLFFLALIITTLSLTFSCQQPQPIPIELGVSKTLADHRKATIKNVEYEVAVAIPDSLATVMNGAVTIRFGFATLLLIYIVSGICAAGLPFVDLNDAKKTTIF